MTELFQRLFDRLPDAVASAPGRVNLMGEHTDYNRGFVLPVALPHRTHVSVARRRDCRVRVARMLNSDHGEIEEYELHKEQPGRGWLDYVQGVTKSLTISGFELAGADLLIASNVPIGKGLSSSAALQVALTRAMRLALDLRLNDLDIARIAHKAETEFVGAPVGVMDQMAASLARQDSALLIDTDSLAYEHVELPPGVELAVVDSGISHHHVTGGYRERRRECERAADLLGVSSLRRISLADLPRIDALPEPLNRRVRHVVTDNARVWQTAHAFRTNSLENAGQLFYESHASMRDDFDVSLPEIDRLVALAVKHSDVLGARLTGGGFGGAVVMLCREGRSADVAPAIASEYRTDTGRDGAVLLPHLS